jgi:hypothetical protein
MTDSTLAATQAAAQAQALAFHGIAPVGARQASRPRRRRWLAAAVMVLSLGAAAAVAALQRPAPVEPRAAQAPVPAGHPARLWETTADVPDAVEPAPPIAPRRPAPAASASLEITATDGRLQIVAQAASRWDAAQQLAALTGTQLLGQPESLAQSRPLALRWQGTDLRSAWLALLGDEVNHGLHCSAPTACRVWVLGPAPAVPAAPAAPAPAAS